MGADQSTVHNFLLKTQVVAMNRREILKSGAALATLAALPEDKAHGQLPRSVNNNNNQKLLQVNTYNLQKGNAYPFVNMFFDERSALEAARALYRGPLYANRFYELSHSDANWHGDVLASNTIHLLP